jgi:hypothetical protein
MRINVFPLTCSSELKTGVNPYAMFLDGQDILPGRIPLRPLRQP